MAADDTATADDAATADASGGEDIAVDESPAYAGMQEVVALMTAYNVVLDVTIEKLTLVSSKLDEVLAKLARIDDAGSGGGGADTGAGATPGSEGG